MTKQMNITVTSAPRKPVAKISRDGSTIYLQGGAGIEEGKHVALGGIYGASATVNGTMDVTVPSTNGWHYQDVYEGDTVTIKF